MFTEGSAAEPQLLSKLALFALAGFAAIGLSCATALAQSVDPAHATPTPPPFAIFPEDDDPGARHRALGAGDLKALDPVEYVPLGAAGTYLSFGGEVREYYEAYDNESWGRPPGGDGYLLQRYLLHIDARVAPMLRTFIEFKSNSVGARLGGPRPSVDEDRGDFNAAFLDLDLVRKSAGGPLATLRYGRQQLDYGAGRLLSAREGPDGQGPNVLLNFDGPRIIARPGSWRIDAFAVKPVLVAPGEFDDRPDLNESLTGVYATSEPPQTRVPGIDLYVLDVTRRNAAFVRGTAGERRYTYGARTFATTRAFDFDVEAIGQFGTFATVPIHAYEAALNVGTHFGDPRRPRLGLQARISSGDRGDPNSFTAFSAPFPRGFYSGLSSLLGPTNVAGLEPNLLIPIGQAVRFEANGYFFWRQSRHDGLYDPAGMPLRPIATNGASYVGTMPEFVAHWDPDVHVGLNVAYSRFLAGSYLRAAPPGRDTDYIASWIRLRF